MATSADAPAPRGSGAWLARHRVDLLAAAATVVLVIVALIPWFRAPTMQAEQKVRIETPGNAQIVAYADQVTVRFREPAAIGAALAANPTVRWDAADVARRTTLSREGDKITVHVTNDDPHRAREEARLISVALSDAIPGGSLVYSEVAANPIVGRAPLGAITLVAAAVVVVAAVLGAGRARAWWWWALGSLGALALLSWLHAPWWLGVVAAATLVAGTLPRLGWWRSGVLLTLSLTTFRSGAFSGLIPDLVWLAGQLGGLVVAAASTFVVGARFGRGPQNGPDAPAREHAWRVAPGRRLDRRDAWALGALAALALWAAATTATSLVRSATAPQAAIFCLVAAFLIITSARRWRAPGMLRRDMVLVFAVAATGIVLAWLPGLPQTARWSVEPRTGRFIGFTSNANFVGTLAAITIAVGLGLLWESRAKLPLLVVSVVLLAPLVESGSRGALLGLAVAALVFVVARRLWRLLAAGVAVAALGGVALALTHRLPSIFQREDGGVDSGRLTLYEGALRTWWQHPIWGTGYRTTERLVATEQTAHNIYLAVLAELGLVGAVVFAALIVGIVAAAIRHRLNPWLPAAAAVGVVELFDSSLFGFSGPASLTMWLIAVAAATVGAFPPCTGYLTGGGLRARLGEWWQNGNSLTSRLDEGERQPR